MRAKSWRYWLLLIALVASHAAWAHSMYQAAILLDYHASGVEAELQLPPSRLAQALHVPVAEAALPSLQPQIRTYLATHLHARASSGAPWSVHLAGRISWAVIDGAPYVVAHLQMTPPKGASLASFTLQSSVLIQEIPAQAVLVSTRSDWNSSTFANDPQLIAVLHGDEEEAEIDRAPGSWTRGFGSVFHLGLRHIAEGTDHLLFLLALLLPAPLLYSSRRWLGYAGLRHGFSQILKVVTAFTIGHSITLAIAASGVLRVPPRPIEVLIALSILISAVHAMRPLFPGREALIAGSFGLIHGLAFASTLGELGLRGWERVASIFAFNVGIESMQLLVVLAVMPSLMLLSRTAIYPAVRWTGALFAAAASCCWILNRTADTNLPIDPLVDGLCRHGLLLAVLLFIFSVVANLGAIRHLLGKPSGSAEQTQAPGVRTT